MAIVQVPDCILAPTVPVDMYIDGNLSESFCSVYEAARAMKVSCETIKYLLATGRELMNRPESITFDVPVDCPYSYVLAEDRNTGRFVPIAVKE